MKHVRRRHSQSCSICCIVPPHILNALARSGTEAERVLALETLAHSARLRGQREILGAFAVNTPAGQKRRTVYTERNGTTLPGKLVRGEGDPKAKDISVNEAYDSSGVVYDFFQKVFARNSVDDRGLRLDSSVHYGRRFDNAFWNGAQMVYGDGDGVIFQRFTRCLDVIGHELTHGVTQYEAALNYQDQPGALNESMSDVFGILVKQWKLKQTAAKTDWLIGAGLLAKGVSGVALRSMKAPGTAYDDPRLGKDPQPAHMKDYYAGHDDNGGVHINSGIPNRAFYLTADAIGGNAWEAPAKIWYTALCHNLRPSSKFLDAANATVMIAGNLYGVGSNQQKAVQNAWKTVGVLK